ncbi:nicotinamidase [Granulicella cerasi]|uniref:nicotinamidase n=1 Tax=Granulicella cerasi TaxID=741063 RepID=A0ABW1ZCU9_9BACT|nr:nicotinamidase [Granulicella cerasi]
MPQKSLELRPTDALLVIDMQHDFLPGGALGVDGGDSIIAPIEQLAQQFEHVILTADWHPAGHISFASTHGKQPFVDIHEAPYGKQHLWPDHCLQCTRGAEIAVNIPHAELILRKGFRREIDSYSAFLENDKTTPTGLAGYLRERGLTRIFLCGLAYDYCVGNSALDAAKLGFEAVVLEDLTRAVAPSTAQTMQMLFDAANITQRNLSEN